MGTQQVSPPTSCGWFQMGWCRAPPGGGRPALLCVLCPLPPSVFSSPLVTGHRTGGSHLGSYAPSVLPLPAPAWKVPSPCFKGHTLQPSSCLPAPVCLSVVLLLCSPLECPPPPLPCRAPPSSLLSLMTVPWRPPGPGGSPALLAQLSSELLTTRRVQRPPGCLQ